MMGWPGGLYIVASAVQLYVYIYTYVYPRMFQDIPIVYIPMFVTSFLGV
jgi:hypothetical protein